MKKYRKSIFCGLLVCSSLCMLALPLGHVNQPKAHTEAVVSVYKEANENQTENKKSNETIKEDNNTNTAQEASASSQEAAVETTSEENTNNQPAAYDPAAQSAQEKETNNSEPAKEDTKEEASKESETKKEDTEVKDSENKEETSKEETKKAEENKEEKEDKESKDSKEKKEDLLAVDPSYTPQRSIISNLTGPIEEISNKENEIDLQKMEEEAQEQAEEEAKADDGVVRASIHPDFNNLAVWQHPESPYHKNMLWGQCTWFAWHRFYEIYGFNPGFSGNGYETAAQLVASHPDKFTLSSTPKAGAVFSLYNHTGIITNVSDDGLITFQDGNMDYVTNYDWNVAINDWRTQTMPLDQFLASNPGVVFANPNFDVVIE